MLRDTHFRPDVAGENGTDEDRQGYLKAAEAIVMDGMADEDVIAKGKQCQSSAGQLPKIGC